MTIPLVVGQKIKFKGIKQRFTIQARNERFLICTKPFNARKTVLYTIVDLVREVRGRDNLVFTFGYETKKQCEDNLKRLADGEMEVSYRNFVKLDYEIQK